MWLRSGPYKSGEEVKGEGGGMLRRVNVGCGDNECGDGVLGEL